MLVLGVFAMFYIKERRVWLLVKPIRCCLPWQPIAKSMDLDEEFQQHSQELQQLLQE